MKVEGLKEPGRAMIQVELFKAEDCEAEFVCQVRGVDSQWREVVSTISLLQQQNSQAKQPNVDHGMPQASPLELAALLQQHFSSSEKNLEDKIVSKLQLALENKVGDLQTNLRDQSDTFERHIYDRLLQLENRIEDKIENTNRNSKPDGVCQPDGKTTAKVVQSCATDKADMLNKLEELQQQVQTTQEQVLGNVSTSLNKIFNSTSDLASTVENQFDLLKSHDPQKLMLTVKRELESLHDVLASKDYSLDLERIRNDTRASCNRLPLRFKELESNVFNQTAEAVSEMKNIILTGFNRSNDFKLLLKDMVSPKYCRKGMVFRLLQNPSRYTVIAPVQNSTDSPNFPHLCDMVTDGGGWIVIQRRVKGDTDFNRNWAEYRQGFGSYHGDFWLGNDKLHAITSSGGTYELRVELTYKGKGAYAYYGDFFVADESENYKLKVGSYHGTAGDGLAYHNGRPFTTIDRDNDELGGNCASYGGGWWFGACDHANLNGNWGAGSDKGVEWEPLAGGNSVSFAEMKIRRM
ncbi:tenascin-R [Elysia marginata]|uniref:Tenascin-R n=1 Tax=Elysia marginata TaxID=1093978 RepID=A0AAV4G2N0_9GAST|nr:tenascin-R [Elysia marginata]